MASARRRAYIDWARGIAVLLMIEAHTTDAWTRAADRRSVAFGWARICGGFAAPLFLWLAGVSVALAAASVAARQGSRTAGAEAVCRRGLEIFILAFLFRMQAFVLSPGSHPLMLFRVDILNVMGPAIAAAALLWAIADSSAVLIAIYAAGATAIAMTAPIVRASGVIDRLPTILQWYLRPAGEYTNFTVFPWAGFVLAGAAAGVVIQRAGEEDARRAQAWLGAIGVVLVLLGAFTAMRPSLYPDSSFWTTSPTYFAIRAGGMMLALSLLFFAEPVVARAVAPMNALARFGRSSLFVYWIHVEIVYGYASWLWRGRLPFPATLLAYVAFSLLMYGAVVLRDRIVSAWRAKRASTRISEPQIPAMR